MSALDKLIDVITQVHEDRCGLCAGGGECAEDIREQAAELYRAVVAEYEGTLT